MREQKGLSEDELSDKTGLYVWAIKSVESDPNYIDSWCLSNIIELSKVLCIPIQLLLGVKTDV
ncbi:helix-turn-helix domain-containing protein [Beggiatoa alba]|uniref:helix-turn-helix domain-containing protein n=1 Tax=Beggiatoa alba TaxID=1022 RepID=UPI00030A657C|nr:helix-turn-helix transcriptional regulator [Beggiatoa alba]